MARRFADAVRDMPAARELCYRLLRGVAEFWLITDRIDLDEEASFYAASQILYDQFPETPIDFHVINPTHFSPFDLAAILPHGISRISLHSHE